jgi:predicted HTH domain antitoxin
MTVSFNIPPEVEAAIARAGRDPSVELKEAGLVELYRLGTVSHGQLAQSLGVSRLQTDAILRRHHVTEDLLTQDELGEQLSGLRKLVG